MSTKLTHLQNLRKILLKSIESVRPVNLFNETNNLNIKPNLSYNENNEARFTINIKNQIYDITNKTCYVVGFGKAVLGMAVQLEKSLKERLIFGIISVPVGTLAQFKDVPDMCLNTQTRIKVIEGAKNNQPDDEALQAAQNIKKLACRMTENDILFVLISGGGSALLPMPRSTITFSEKMSLIKNLANRGANIREMNIVRILLSGIKGGRLAEAASNANNVISLIISDIVNDPIDMIASGPTCLSNKVDRPTAQNILQNYNLWSTLSNDTKTTIKCAEENDVVNVGSNNTLHIIGNNQTALANAREEAESAGYYPFVATQKLEGDVATLAESYSIFITKLLAFKMGELSSVELQEYYPFDIEKFRMFINAIEESRRRNMPLLVIIGGEPTVWVTAHGLGGRNQELSLRMALEFYKNDELKDMIFLSAGTDGIDGPTPAAGAIACNLTIEDFLLNKEKTLEDVEKYIINNDSYNFYKETNDGHYHIITGHTGTNVMDIQLLLINL